MPEEFDPILDDLKRRRAAEAELEASVRHGSAFDPAQRAKVQRTAQQLGVEPEAIEQDYDTVRREVDLQVLGRYAQRSPKAAKFLSDPRVAEVAHKDTTPLSEFELLYGQADKATQAELARQARNKEKSWIGALSAPLLSGVALGIIGRPLQAGLEILEDTTTSALDVLGGIGTTAKEIALPAVSAQSLNQSVQNIKALWLGPGKDRSGAVTGSKLLGEQLDSWEKANREASWEASGSYNPIKNPALYYNMLAENAPQLGAQRVLAMATYSRAMLQGANQARALSLATKTSASLEGIQIFGSAYHDARVKGLDTFEAAAIASAITVPSVFVSQGLPAMEGAVARLEAQGIKSGVRYKATELAEQGLEGMFLNSATKSWAQATGFGGVAKRTAMGVVKEGAEELLQEEISMAGERIYDPNAYANAADRRIQSALGGALLGGIGGLAHGKITDPFVKQKEFLEALMSADKRAEFVKHAPERLGQFVTELTKDGSLKNVYHSAEGWVQFWQTKGLNVEAAKAEATKLGIAPVDFDTALARGGDLVIPTAKLAQTGVGKAEYAELLPTLKPQMGGPTFNEREDARLKEAIAAHEKKLVQQLITENPQHPERALVREQIAMQMRGVKAFRGDANAIDEVADSYATVITGLAMRSNQSPMQLFEAEKVIFMRGVEQTVREQELPMAAQRKALERTIDRIRGKMMPKQEVQGVPGAVDGGAAPRRGSIRPLRQGVGQQPAAGEPGLGSGEGVTAESLGAGGTVAQQQLAAARTQRLTDYLEGRSGTPTPSARQRVLLEKDDPAALVRISSGGEDKTYPWALPVEGTTLGGNTFTMSAGVLHVSLPDGGGELQITLVPGSGIANGDTMHINEGLRGTGVGKNLLQDAAQLVVAAYPEVRVFTGELTTDDAKNLFASYPGSRYSEDGRQVAVPIAEISERASTFEQKLTNAFQLAGIDVNGLTNDQALDALEAHMRESGGTIYTQPLSTRLPKAKKGAADPFESLLLSDYASIADAPEYLGKLLDLVRKYDGVQLDPKLSQNEQAEQFIQHVQGNLTWLFNQMSPDLRKRAKLWYEGANKIAEKWAGEHSKTLSQVSGVLAVLSPQRDWFANVSLAARIIDFYQNRQGSAWSPKFDAVAQKMLKAEEAGTLIKAKAAFKKKHGMSFADAVKQAKAAGKKKLPQLELKELSKTGFAALYEQVKGKSYKQVKGDRAKAFWIRLYDGAFNDPSVPLVSPEGEFGEPVKTLGGESTKIQWGGLDTITKALNILEDASAEQVSAALGGAHKVRNFYNNIFDPAAPDFVTIDTHAVAAGLLLPLGGSSPEVTHNLSGPSRAASGNEGTYALYQEAYVRAAREAGVLPREMQSITWEAVRGLFRPEDKRSEAKVKLVRSVWKRKEAGDITTEQARAEISEIMGGILTPSWAGQTEEAMRDELDSAGFVGSVNVESMPGAALRSDIFPNIGRASLEQLKAYHSEKMKIVADTLAAAGIQVALQVEGHGYWEGETNLVTSFKVLSEDPAELQRAAQIVADTVDDQDAIGTNYAVVESDETKHNAHKFVLSRELTAEEMVVLGKALEAVPGGFVDASNPAVLKHISYDFTYNPNYHNNLGDLVQGALPEGVIIEEGSGSYKAESNLVERSNALPVEATATGGRDLQGEAIAGGRKSILDLNAKLGQEFGWGPGKFGHSRHTVHYSNAAGLTYLDSSFYGKGSPGGEQKRLAGAPPELRERIHLYPTVNGILPQPERTVRARIPYEAEVSNIYDLEADPEGLRAQALDANDMELRVLRAGYSGYWAPSPGDNGSIVLLGKRTLPVSPLGQPDSFAKVLTLEELRQMRGDSAGVPGPEPTVLRQPAVQDNKASLPTTTFVTTDLIKEADRPLGAKKITDAESAAAAFAYLGISPMERFDAIVTDKKGKPIAVVGGFKGGIDYTLADAATITDAVFRVRGAANVWFGHNHPSGAPGLSGADLSLNSKLNNLFAGTAVEPRGILAIGSSSAGVYDFNHSDGSAGSVAPEKFTKTPLVERVFTHKVIGSAPQITGPRVLKDWVNNSEVTGKTGMILLDSKSRPSAFVEITDVQASKLRGTGVADDLFRASSISPHKFVIIVDPKGELSKSSITNLRKFYEASDRGVVEVLQNDITAGGVAALGKLTDTIYRSKSDAGDTRGYLSFDPGLRGAPKRTFNLGLLKSENRSTVFHELGHLYLEILGDLATAPNADPTLVQDYQTILDWFGVQSREQITTQMHENFADAHLKYLREGKTKNPELQKSFRKFSSWLKKIWTTITSDMVANGTADVEVSEPVREVFDRLYMGDVAVNEASNAADLQSFTAESLGMTVAEHKSYLAKQQELAKKASEQLVSKLMADLEKQHTEEWEQELAEREEAALKRLANEPGYQAMAQMLSGQLADGTPVEVKLSREMVKAKFGPKVAASIRPELYAKEGGLDADGAAVMLGFDDGQALVNALSGKPMIEVAAAEQAKEAMILTHGDLAQDREALMAEAIEIFNGQGMEELILAELDGLSRKVAERSAKRAADKAEWEAGAADRAAAGAAKRAAYVAKIQGMRAAAKSYISGMQAFLVQPHQYLRTQQKLNKQAFQAASSGDQEGAIKLKEQELLNHYLYLEAMEAKEFTKTFQQWVRKNDKSTVRSKMARAGGEFLAQFDALRDRFSIQRVPNKQLQRTETLRTWVEGRQAQGEETAVAVSLLDESKQFNYRELTTEELHKLHDAMRNIKHLAYEQLGTIIDGKRVEYADMQEEIRLAAEANLTKKDIWRSGSRKREKAWFKITAALAGADASMVKIQQLVNWIDGNNVNGPMHRFVWNRLKKAQADEAKMQMLVTKKVSDAFEAMPAHLRTTLSDEINVPGWKDPLSRKELITVALYWGQDERRTKMLGGFAGQGITKTMLETALTQLTAEDTTFINRTWEILDEIWPDIAALEKRVKGVEPERQVNSPFTIRNAQGQTLEFRGGYFPYVADRKLTGKLAKIQEGGTVQQVISGNNYAKATTSTGHTKELTEKAYLPDLEFDYILSTHLVNVVKDLTHRETVMSVNRIFQNESFQMLMKERLGEEYEAQLQPWLVNVVSDNNVGASQGLRFWNSLLRKSRAHTSTAMLGYNLLSGIVQITDAPRLMAPGDYRVSVWRFHGALARLILNPKKTLEMVRTLSPEMAQRANNLDRDARAAIQALKSKHTVYANFQKQAFWLFGAMDAITSTAGWLASYEQSVAKHGNEEQAIHEADRTISMRLMTGAPKDLPAILRKNGGEWLQLVTMFMGDATANYNMLRNAGHNIQGFKGVPTFLGIGAVISMTQILAALIKDQGPGEDEEEWRWVARKAMLAPLSTVPVGRDVGNTLEDIAAGKPVRDFRVTPALLPIQKLLQATDTIVDYNMEDSDKGFGDVTLAVADAFGSVAGVAGTRQIVASGKFFDRYLEGDEEASENNAALFTWNLAKGKKKEKAQ